MQKFAPLVMTPPQCYGAPPLFLPTIIIPDIAFSQKVPSNLWPRHPSCNHYPLHRLCAYSCQLATTPSYCHICLYTHFHTQWFLQCHTAQKHETGRWTFWLDARICS